MAGRLLAIGDIHGCARALQTLLAAVAPSAEDTVVVLGDVLDRGPDSRGVVDQLLALRNQCHLRPILGNHEEMALAVFQKKTPPDQWIRFGGGATLESYGLRNGLEAVPEEHVAFLQTFVDYFEEDDLFFVHANYEAQLPLSAQKAEWLRWRSLDECLPAPHCSGKTAIVGHTPDRTGELFSWRHLVCIDTYCYGGGWLTALEPRTGRYWQASEAGELRQLRVARHRQPP